MKCGISDLCIVMIYMTVTVSQSKLLLFMLVLSKKQFLKISPSWLSWYERKTRTNNSKKNTEVLKMVLEIFSTQVCILLAGKATTRCRSYLWLSSPSTSNLRPSRLSPQPLYQTVAPYRTYSGGLWFVLVGDRDRETEVVAILDSEICHYSLWFQALSWLERFWTYCKPSTTLFSLLL